MKSGQEQTAVENRQRGNLLAVLKQAQARSGHVSRVAVGEAAQSLGLTVSETYGVATFYSFLSAKPLGRNVIRICQNLPCHFQGGEQIMEAISEEIGIGVGQTTDDGKFSLEMTNCIGACDTAPAMLINGDVHGDLTPGKVREIMKSYD